ncbi:unnamed protein product [Ixodes persulcatus]
MPQRHGTFFLRGSFRTLVSFAVFWGALHCLLGLSHFGRKTPSSDVQMFRDVQRTGAIVSAQLTTTSILRCCWYEYYVFGPAFSRSLLNRKQKYSFVVVGLLCLGCLSWVDAAF